MKQKNNCEALPDIITQGIMRVHLLSNTAVTKSRKVFASWTFHSSSSVIYIP